VATDRAVPVKPAVIVDGDVTVKPAVIVDGDVTVKPAVTTDREVTDEASRGIIRVSPPSAQEHVGTSLLERAQDLMYRARSEADAAFRIELAKQALEICSDCADAYLLLGQEAAESPEQAIDFYQKAIDAGERALGPTPFKSAIGHFWGVLEARPYLRARLALGNRLWEDGQIPQAMEEYRELLRLNGTDHLRVRYRLLRGLIEQGLNRGAIELLECYRDEDSTEWCYFWALVMYVTEGDCEVTRQALVRAIELNERLARFLTAGANRPDSSALSYGVSSEVRSALDYINEYGALWDGVHGAIEWLTEYMETSSAGKG